MTAGATGYDDSVLDDPGVLARLDAGEMLRAVATAGAQVREALLHVEPAMLEPVVADDRPRAVVVTGMGGSGIVAEVVAAVAGPACPVPVHVVRGYRLPGWVGPMDLVVAVSCSGETAETLSALDEAHRRGARVVTVGARESALTRRGQGSRSVHLPVDAKGRMPRANLWGLAVPVLLLLDALGLLNAPRSLLDRVADDLDRVSERCGPAADVAVNPAKALALQLAGSLPYVWGSSELAGVAAARFAAQLAENAKYPAVPGTLTEVHHNQVVVMAGRFGVLSASDDDIFRDRVEEGPPWPRMRVLVLRDTEEVPAVAHAREATRVIGERYDVQVDELPAEGDHPLDRLASLVAPLDFASAYLALVQGIDPSPIEPIVALKKATAKEHL
jgi:glucose/mannose-6-phosphate isomerase